MDIDAYIGEMLDLANDIYDDLTDEERENVNNIDDALSIYYNDSAQTSIGVHINDKNNK